MNSFIFEQTESQKCYLPKVMQLVSIRAGTRALPGGTVNADKGGSNPNPIIH